MNRICKFTETGSSLVVTWGGVGWRWGVMGCCSVSHSCPTLCDPMDFSTPGFPVFYHFPKLAQTHVHWVSDAIQPPYPLLAPSPFVYNLSQHQGLFQWISSLHPVTKVLELQLQHHPSKEIPGLIPFRMDWLDLLAVQGTLKSLLQHHSSKPSIIQRSAFFMVQFSYPYMTTGKTIALTRQTFVGKVMSLLFFFFFVFLCLIYFIQHNILQIHPCWYK